MGSSVTELQRILFNDGLLSNQKGEGMFSERRICLPKPPVCVGYAQADGAGRAGGRKDQTGCRGETNAALAGLMISSRIRPRVERIIRPENLR